MRGRRTLAWLLALTVAAGCGGGQERGASTGGAGVTAGGTAARAGRDAGGAGVPAQQRFRGESLTAWTNEYQPDRMRKTRAILDDFTRRTGATVRLVAVPEDGLATMMARAAAARTLPDVVFATPLAASQAYARQHLFDPGAAQAVVDRLGRATFSGKALGLVGMDGKATGVPSDGWGQLLIYRRDLLARARLAAPKTLEDVRAAAARLDRPGRAGIALGTAPRDGFTEESFEHVALAMGCQLVDRSGRVTFDSPACIDALRYYADLARHFAPKGTQDVDSTRDAYFAGRAAMILWSPFLLDAMAGLRDDVRPTCPQCRQDPAFLAKNSGLVGPLSEAGGEPSQFGSISTFNIGVGADEPLARALVEFMMSDGYVRWLDLSPPGKFPVRFGDRADPQRFVLSWLSLRSGVERKARLSDFYSRASIESLGEGVVDFKRWGFAEGQGALIGAMSAAQPVSRAVAAVVAGQDPARVAGLTQRRLRRLQAQIE